MNLQLFIMILLVVFNDAGQDLDFRGEGDADAHTLFVQGSSDSVHVGTSASGYTGKFTVYDDTSSNNKIIAHFQGAGVGSGTSDGGQYISVGRTGPISGVASIQGGIIFGANAATGPSAQIAGVYQYTSGRDLRFLTTHNNTSDVSLRMTLNGSGQLSVGLSYVGDGAYITCLSNGGEGLFNGVNGTNAYRRYYHTVSDGIHRFKGSANTATLSNAGAWGDASDIAYKKDIVDTVYGLDTVKQFQPRDFVLKADETDQTGFIAQEMETVCPQFVVGEEGTKTINYGQITSVLTKAIQEQQTIIEGLKTRIETLEKS